MGIFSLKPSRADAIAPLVSYKADVDEQKLLPGFKQRHEGKSRRHHRIAVQALAGADVRLDTSRTFSIDHSFRTPIGTVVTHENGLVVQSQEDASTYAVVLPVRRRIEGSDMTIREAAMEFISGTMIATQVELSTDAMSHPKYSPTTMAVAQAIVELGHGTITEPGASQ